MLDPMFSSIVATGDAVYTEDGLLVMQRHGYAEECYFNYNVSPILDDAGAVAGLFNTVVEVTGRVLAERRARQLRHVADRLVSARTAEQVVQGTISALAAQPADLPFVLMYQAAPGDGTAVLLAAAGLPAGHPARPEAVSLTEHGAPWPLREASERRCTVLVPDVAVRAGGPLVLTPWPEPVTTACVVPILMVADPGEAPAAFLVCGLNPCRAFDDVFREFVSAVADRAAAGLVSARITEVEGRFTAELAQQVAERTAELDRVWRNAQDLQVVIDAAGTFHSVSPAATRLLGWLPEEMVGRTVFDFTHPECHPASAGALARAAAAPMPPYQNRYRHRDGSYRRIAWTTTPEGGLIYCYGRDVTVEVEQAESLRRTEEALRQSQKMEAVGQLTGGLAHDFNNLLAGISGSLDLLQRRVEQGRVGDLDRYIIAAQGAAKRAAALTHRLLAFSRRQTLDPRPINVAALIQGMTELVQRTVGPAITVETVGMVGLWTALVDPNQLENALLNLCINARDAMPDGGRLTIETGNRWMDDRTARERDVRPGQYLSICVTDTGTGMPPDVVARAFDPFFTTKPLGQGTGLGLSMIYGFATQSGGQVRIYSEVGQGTTVCIYLPRHYGDAAAPDAPAAAPGALPHGTGEAVLIVDDEATIRMLVSDVLGDLGYLAVEAEDGPSALKVLQGPARVDLLVTDVGLPGGMNGRQVADAARALRPGLKVLFITGYAENAAVGNGQLDPGMAVMTKPFAMDDLAAKIRALVRA